MQCDCCEYHDRNFVSLALALNRAVNIVKKINLIFNILKRGKLSID